MSTNINIVLVNTSHPGNIGSTARAMKTMGLKNLKLVSPKEFPSDIANAKAVGCIDILKNADIHRSLSESLSSSKIVVGFSARLRKSNIPSLSMHNLIKLITSNRENTISVVFGNEQSGLSNEELQLCDYLVSIPTHNAYTSLNLASAVQIFAYEYFKSIKKAPSAIKPDDLVSHSSKLHLINLLLSIMERLNIITNKNKNSLTQNIHIIFNKSNLTSSEANLYLGILSKIEKALQK
tara:strand:+ start:4090 stop:4800 length:711 start_codon:yes stop_codon:yes gene_type:complete